MAPFFRIPIPALTQRDLLDSPVELRHALTTGRSSLWRYEVDSRTLFNDGVLDELLGINGASADWIRVVHPDDLNRVQMQWMSACEGRSSRLDIELRLLDCQGKTRWFHAYGNSGVGTPRVVAGVIQEITERKHAEEELRELSRYNRQLLEISPDPIFVLDAVGTILDINPAAVSLTRLERSRLVGVDFAQHFSDPLRARQLWTDALTISTVRDAEIGLLSDVTNQAIPLLCNATALAAEDGSPRGVLIVARDISARKAAEAERFMTEARVRETQKLESLGVLAGGIAHDFNNLLTGILGNASLAKLDLASGTPPFNCVEEIEKASLRAAELCRQMLAYSGKGRFVVQLLDLSELISEAAPLLELSTTKKAKLRFFLNKNLPLIQADVNQLRQVVINLVSNAAESIGDKDGAIRITTGSMRATRAYLHQTHLSPDLPEGLYSFVEVNDNGAGIAPDVLPRIFEPFYSTKFTGRGLGLSAVLGIVRGHNGTIKVDSESGKGASFLVLFPAAEQSALVPAEQPVTAPAVHRILVVDDEETVRSVLARMLQSFGYEAVTAVNGQQAVQFFHAERTDIHAVLLDLTMPELDGAETFREIHRLRPDLPVILMSGYSERDAVSRFAAQGLAGFLQKPFQPDTLRSLLASVVAAAD